MGLIFVFQNTTEFVKVMNGYRNDLRANRKRGYSYLRLFNVNKTLPSTVDWRDQGLVTPVKNQVRINKLFYFVIIKYRVFCTSRPG